MPLSPGKKSPFDIALQDGKSSKEWMLKFEGEPIRDVLADDTNNLYLRNVGKKIGDFDEQRDWRGGMGNEYFAKDPTAFYDSSAYTLSPEHLTPQLKWRYGTGYRTVFSNLADSVAFKPLLGAQKYITVAVTTGAITADACWVWIRRRGNPSDLTLEVCTDSAGNPNTVLKTITVSTTNITDLLSVLWKFDWTGTQSLSAATTYHFKLYGGATSNEANHWEIGVDTSTSLSKISSAGSVWAAPSPTFSTQIRVVDAEIARRWLFYGGDAITDFFAASIRDTGNSDHYTISGTVATVNTSTGLGVLTGKPVVINGIHYFPQGESDIIRRWNGSAWRDEGAGKFAIFLAEGYDSTDGPVLWRSNSNAVSRATLIPAGTPIAWAADGVSMLNWDTAVQLSTIPGGITSIYFWTNNGLYVFKRNAVFNVTKNGTAYKATLLNFGLESTPSVNNGVGIVAHKQFLYWSWLYSVERLYGGTLDDVGLGWKSRGLPDGREGNYSCMASYINSLFVGIDAGATGTSSVLAWDGLTWHEFFRAPAAGMRIRNIAIQPQSNNGARLWIDCGNEMIYIDLPTNRSNPLDSTSTKYMHEGYIVSSTIDMGTASKLPKFIKELTATVANLNGNGIRVDVDYQVDDKIGKTGYNYWTTAKAFTFSPEDTTEIGESCTQFRYRLRLQTDNASTPPDVRGIVPSGHARGAYKWVWTFRIATGNGKGKGKINRDAFDDWVYRAGRTPGRIHMTSTWKSLHNYDVVVSPPRLRAMKRPVKNKQELDVYEFTLVEV